MAEDADQSRPGIRGYTFGGKAFDALVFGYYEGGKLIYAARTCNGFTRRPAQV
jgi:hypothetical protein